MPNYSEITRKCICKRSLQHKCFSKRKSYHAKMSGKILNDNIEEAKEKKKVVYQLQHGQCFN